MLVFLIVATIILYSWNLLQVPVHLNQDELGFTLNAYSITTTGFDENGRFMPFYFWHLGVMWATPIIVYLTAIFLKILPLSEIVIRLPSVLVGTVNLVLIYFIAKKLFKSRLYGLVAVLLLALAPAHFIHSRILLDNLFIVPFILGWFYLILLFMEKRRVWLIFFASILLGLGVHSYHAAKVMMPIYLFFTLAFLYRELIKNKFLIFVILTGFALPLIPLIPWLSKYPDTLLDQVKYTSLYDTKLNPIQGLLTLFTPETILERLSIYLTYFHPGFLFLKGDLSLIHSTQRIGVFLLPFILLIPLGICRAVKTKNKLWLLLAAGFFTAPVAPALVGNQYRASKELAILPFAVLIAVYGLHFILRFFRGKYILVVISCLLILIFLQFALFLNDYFGGYRIRSYGWFNYDISGSLEALIEQDEKEKSNMIYLDSSINFIDRYWRFYLIKHNRLDLLNKTLYFNPETVSEQSVEINSLFLARYDHADSWETINEFRKVVSVSEPDGFVSFYIYKN